MYLDQSGQTRAPIQLAYTDKMIENHQIYMIRGNISDNSDTSQGPCGDQNSQNKSSTSFLGMYNCLGVVKKCYGLVCIWYSAIISGNPPSHGTSELDCSKFVKKMLQA